jgi:TPR repeat protein
MNPLTRALGLLFFAILVARGLAGPGEDHRPRKPPQLPKEVAEGLAAAPSITLYSLQPWAGPNIPQWDFHGHHILGCRVLSPDEARTAIAALNAALAAGDADLGSGCVINPRHALAFQIGRDTFHVVICYQCGQLELFKNDQSLPFEGMIGGKPDVLNGLLEAAGIPLADEAAALKRSYAAEAKVALELAEQGDAKAQNVIARMLMSGRGVKKDEAKGIKWLGKSMASPPDRPDFQVTLGKMYRQDNDLQQDYAKAMALFQQAAAQGSAEAQYQIGELYDFGEGVAKNPAEAMKWIRQAAENGNAVAQFEVGVRCAQGRDVKQDYAEALRWLTKAANQVHPEALCWMGSMYDEGWGVPQDRMKLISGINWRSNTTRSTVTASLFSQPRNSAPCSRSVSRSGSRRIRKRSQFDDFAWIESWKSWCR